MFNLLYTTTILYFSPSNSRIFRLLTHAEPVSLGLKTRSFLENGSFRANSLSLCVNVWLNRVFCTVPLHKLLFCQTIGFNKTGSFKKGTEYYIRPKENNEMHNIIHFLLWYTDPSCSGWQFTFIHKCSTVIHWHILFWLTIYIYT